MTRLIAAVLAGCLIACLAAVTLGEYPLTGAIPWLACVIVPALIGTAMAAIAGRHQRALWFATGPLSCACLAWGVGISTTWGLEPLPSAAWAEMTIGLAWPIVWAALGNWRPAAAGRTAAAQPAPAQPAPAEPAPAESPAAGGSIS